MGAFSEGEAKCLFKQLLSAAGWKLEKVVPTNGIFMVIEASPN